MTDLPFGVLVAASAVAALVVGFLKTSIGGGIGLILPPTLSLVLAPRVALALLVPLMGMSDPLTLRYFWRQWDTRQLRVLFPTLVIGLVLGTWLLTLLSAVALARVLGGVALGFAVVHAAVGRRTTPLFGEHPHWSVGALAGLLSGLASAVAHLGGVILWIYLLGVRLMPTPVVATIAVLMAAANVVKVTGYWQIGFLTPAIVAADLITSPLLLLGGWLGYRVNRWLPRRVFEIVIVTIAVIASLRLLLS